MTGSPAPRSCPWASGSGAPSGPADVGAAVSCTWCFAVTVALGDTVLAAGLVVPVSATFA